MYLLGKLFQLHNHQVSDHLPRTALPEQMIFIFIYATLAARAVRRGSQPPSVSSFRSPRSSRNGSQNQSAPHAIWVLAELLVQYIFQDFSLHTFKLSWSAQFQLVQLLSSHCFLHPAH